MTELELYHYGVKGMKWGVRQAREAGRELDRKKRAYKRAKRSRDISTAIAKRTGGNWNEVAYKSNVADAAKYDYKMAKREFRQNAPTRVKVERGIKSATATLGKVGALYIADQKYFAGAGTDATKAALKVVGMTAVTAYSLASGHRNIRWTRA